MSEAVDTKAPRVVLLLAAFLAGLAVILAAIFVVGGLSPTPGRGIATIGGPFHLTDQNGKPFSDQDMKGKPYLVFFGYTHCPDICPTTLFEMSQLMGKLGPDANRVGALFITVDPERDTTAVLKDYLASFDPHLRGLTGAPAAIDQAIKDYRVYAKKVPLQGGDYTMDHTALVYLMDKEGRFVAPFDMQRKADVEAAEVRRYF
jgi:protein SCO1